MLWRAPWLKQRKVLVGLAAWDASSLYLAYNLTYIARLGEWKGVSTGLIVMTTTWLGSSYLAGRYSPQRSGEAGQHLTRLFPSVVAAAVVTGLFVAHSWIYQVVDAQTRFRGFLIPLVVGASALSTIGQVIFSGRERKVEDWILVGNKEERDCLKGELESGGFGMRKIDLRAVDHIGGSGNESIAVGDLTGAKEEVVSEILERKEQGQSVVPLLSWCEMELQRIPPELVSAEWLIQAEGFRLRKGSLSWRTKRFGDIIGAVTLLILTLPLLVAVCVLIWVDDRGPVFYSQVRSGICGHPIRIWKLRSMKVNAEEGGAQWAKNKDPRVTRVGRVIRATRIDELPQLLSVIKGDLSLIGPRPERPTIEEELERKIPNYRVRHWIRPGLSGWAQVCFPYGASIEDSRMKLSYDIYYLRNAGILLDLLIALKTLRLVAGAKGASPRK